VLNRGLTKMKIEELNKNSAVSYPSNGRTDRSEVADAHVETVARQQAATDKVELTSYKPVVLTSEVRPGARVSQVAEIKTRVDNGSYHVPSRAVAEKMLSKMAVGASQQSSL
jgi:flagellar biosynthesis anti-sigma factor FlgM